MRSTLIALLFALLSLTACETTRPVDSEPQKAKVYVDGVFQGTTPCTIKLPTSGMTLSATMKVEKEGYKIHQQSIEAIHMGNNRYRWPDNFFVRLVPEPTKGN